MKIVTAVVITKKLNSEFYDLNLKFRLGYIIVKKSTFI